MFYHALFLLLLYALSATCSFDCMNVVQYKLYRLAIFYCIYVCTNPAGNRLP